jgi:hypothetical protein
LEFRLFSFSANASRFTFRSRSHQRLGRRTDRDAAKSLTRIIHAAENEDASGGGVTCCVTARWTPAGRRRTSLQSAWPLVLACHPALPVVVTESAARLSSDGGLLVVREFDARLDFTARFAAALEDTRDPAFTRHDWLSLVRQRLYGRIADDEDRNDHDELRHDPVFQLVCDRLPGDGEPASQPTLSRFENAGTIADWKRLREVLLDQFLDSFAAPPVRITLDLDAFDDETHGRQPLTFRHGFHEQFQDLPIASTGAETDAVVLVGLRHGACAAFLGADDDLRRIAGRIRERRPDVEIVVRADSGFGVPVMSDVCEERGLTFTFGCAMNARWPRQTPALLEAAVSRYEAPHEKPRRFARIEYQADSGPHPRTVIVQSEAHAAGTNRGAIVTNRPGAAVLPQGAYDEYAQRGESENRNKELQDGLHADRPSDHRFRANFFRLFPHAAALNLPVRLRRATTQSPTPAALGVPDPLPAAALPERSKKRFFKRRRRHDPLGEGQPCTWRRRLIKVAAEVIVGSRRVPVKRSSSWPHAADLFRIGRLVALSGSGERRSPVTPLGTRQFTAHSRSRGSCARHPNPPHHPTAIQER